MAVNRQKVSRSCLPVNSVRVPCPFEPNVSFSARIHCSKVSKAVNLLKNGVGFDGIHTNHLKYFSKLLIFFLTMSLPLY